MQIDELVRLRRAGEEEDWCYGRIVASSNSTPVESIGVMLTGVLRAANGYWGGVCPLTIDYEAERVTGLDGQEYELEIADGPV